MDLSLCRCQQVFNEGCTAAVGALHSANTAWDQGPLCMESPIWFRFMTLCILLLHKGALEHPGEEETCHNSLPSHCETQTACRRQRAANPPENFISMRTEKMPRQPGACWSH